MHEDLDEGDGDDHNGSEDDDDGEEDGVGDVVEAVKEALQVLGVV